MQNTCFPSGKEGCLCLHEQPLSRVQVFATPWTVAHQAPLSWDFPGKNTGVRLPFPSPGDLPNLGMKSVALVLAGVFFTTEPPGKPQDCLNVVIMWFSNP